MISRLPTGPKAAIMAAILLNLTLAGLVSAQAAPDRSLVPARIRDPILLELSGELAYAHVQVLALNRQRPVEEYTDTYMETAYMQEMATRYGLSDVRADYFPAGEAWVPEIGDLWMVEPTHKKIASLTMVPAALASGSSSGDVEAEVVYVGSGRPSDFEGKDLAGKIALGNTSVGQVFNQAVGQRGAVGALGTGSAGTSRDNAGYTLDQIGWASIRSRGAPSSAGASGFGFNLSLRQFNEMRNLLERGERVVLRAHVRTRMVPGRMNVVSAAIPGTDPDAGELMIVSHLFERPPTPGGSDNCSGVAVTLEIGRTLAELIDRGELPQPRRTIRFLWVPEISGSRAYMMANPDLGERLIAAMNYDMPGEDLEETDSYLRMKMTPDSEPSYLNDLIGNLLQFVDQTEIRTQTGNNAPFNYRLVPFIRGSDHTVFLEAGIPAMQFNHWPDNFYHSSADVVERTDPTEMKRTGFMGASSFYYLATAGADEALDLAWESAANGEKWMAEVARQAVRLLEVDAGALPDRYKAARNKVYGAFHRARGTVESVTDLSDEPAVLALVESLTAQLEEVRDVQWAKLATAYRMRAEALGVRPQEPSETSEERRYSQVVPRMRFDVYTEEYQAALGRLQRSLPAGFQLPGLAAGEIVGFVDGERSVTEIWRLVRAEYGNVTTSNTDWKFAYVVTPETLDIDLASVVAYIEAMDQAGLVELTRG